MKRVRRFSEWLFVCLYVSLPKQERRPSFCPFFFFPRLLPPPPPSSVSVTVEFPLTRALSFIQRYTTVYLRSVVLLHISYKDHVINVEVRAKIQQAIGPHDDLLTIVKRRELQWYGHVSRSSGLPKSYCKPKAPTLSLIHI